jgi:hypothetical protein
MEVISINQKNENKRKEDMLEIIDYIKKQIETGQILEFVACSLDRDGMSQIHVSTLDVPGAVGLFEIGKHTLIQQDQAVDF